MTETRLHGELYGEYMGLAPPMAEVRDLVCISLGGDVPFILRPCGSLYTTHYELVEEAYGR